MPIATCFVREGVASGPDVHALARRWADEAGRGGRDMTVNVVTDVQQAGAPMAVIALLHLPSLWSPPDIQRLQDGLARALQVSFGLGRSDVQVITSVVASGHVVEDGETQEW